ncbi:MAG: polyprenyl synthetase family protein, partial [Bacteroidales bacterium]
VTLLYKLGISMGLGFQLQDDWMDCYGNEDKFGKPIGKDIINNKKTYLWILANQRAAKKDKEALNNIIENTIINNKEKIDFVLNIYDQLDISRIVLEKINTCFDDASKMINEIEVDEKSKAELKKFIHQLNKRDT